MKVSHVLSEKGYNKQSKTEQIIGLSFEDFHKHLIQTCIDTYGKFDVTLEYAIDHIIPVATAKTEEELIELNHYTNLQLITEEDNARKGSKILDRPITNR
jgi:hypothetical protein